MGFFKNIKESFNAGRNLAKENSYRRKKEQENPVKLVEPSTGNIIKLQLFGSEETKKICISFLKDYAKSLQVIEETVRYESDGDFFVVIMPEDMAEAQRTMWRR